MVLPVRRPAIDRERLTGHEGRSVGKQEKKGADEVIGDLRAMNALLKEDLPLLCCRHRLALHFRERGPGEDGIHANPVPSQLA